MEQTQGWWHKTTQKHGYKKRQVLTVGNVEVTLMQNFSDILLARLYPKLRTGFSLYGKNPSFLAKPFSISLIIG